MRAIIVHDSHTGNGEKLAGTLREHLTGHGFEVSVDHVSVRDPADAANAGPDLLVVGAALRKFQLSRASRRWLTAFDAAARRAGITVACGAVFVTHGLPRDKVAWWAERFRRRMSRCTTIRHVHPDWVSGRVTAMAGPLADDVPAEIERHARLMAEAIS